MSDSSTANDGINSVMEAEPAKQNKPSMAVRLKLLQGAEESKQKVEMIQDFFTFVHHRTTKQKQHQQMTSLVRSMIKRISQSMTMSSRRNLALLTKSVEESCSTPQQSWLFRCLKKQKNGAKLSMFKWLKETVNWMRKTCFSHNEAANTCWMCGLNGSDTNHSDPISKLTTGGVTFSSDFKEESVALDCCKCMFSTHGSKSCAQHHPSSVHALGLLFLHLPRSGVMRCHCPPFNVAMMKSNKECPAETHHGMVIKQAERALASASQVAKNILGETTDIDEELQFTSKLTAINPPNSRANGTKGTLRETMMSLTHKAVEEDNKKVFHQAETQSHGIVCVQEKSHRHCKGCHGKFGWLHQQVLWSSGIC